MKRYGYLLFLVCIVCLINSCRKEDGCATAYCGRWDTLADTGYYSCGTVVDNYIYTMWTPKEIRKMTRNADSFNYGNAKKIRVCGWWFKPHETIFLCDDNLTSLNPFTDACFPTESCEGWLKCDFRNNMIYAVAVGGIIAILLQKGLKKKLIFLGVILATILCFKGTEKLLIKTTGAYVKDTERESMSVPLMCLARVAVYHRDELTDLEYNEILAYIPEDSLQNYSYVISDGIKNNANENLLKTNKTNFLKLVAKIGLKHPVEYIETFVGLTAGYYYPFDYPYFLGGTTKLFTEPVYGEYPMVANKNILPFGTEIMDYLFKDTDGRLRVPLLGWFWKSTFYVWGYIFTFFYLLYRKDKKGLSIMIIPLMYLATCFLGPVSWMRYIYINIATMPVITYLCTHSKKN